MSSSIGNIGLKTFKPLASPVRLKILQLLYRHGALRYIDLIKFLGMDPERDAGKFAYHLRTLLNANLIELDQRERKYVLSRIGRGFLDFYRSMEDLLTEGERKLLVRTSRTAIEAFDESKIAKALVREAEVPTELAKGIAEEVKDRLSRLRIKYLTAPLIREFVNAILIEKGLEEFRHKLTRLGMPVYDVSQKLEEAGRARLSVKNVPEEAGRKVLKEYVLLKALPRDVADAHLDGTIYICELDDWILKPREFQHDFRPFLLEGFMSSYYTFPSASLGPPKTLDGFLSLVISIAVSASSEISKETVMDYANVILAPFTRGLPSDTIKRALRLFILQLNRIVPNFVIGLELGVPKHLRDEEAIGPNGHRLGRYGDFEEEARDLFSIFVDALREDCSGRPIVTPYMIVKIEAESFEDEEAKALLTKAHEVAASYGTPYFASRSGLRQEVVSYFPSGSRLPSDWTEDWELDTLRTGVLGEIVVNLPRIAYEARGDDDRFFEALEGQMILAKQAFIVKNESLERGIHQGMLPVLSRRIRGEAYFRLKNSVRNIGLMGLNEAAKAHTGSYLLEDESSFQFALKTVKLAGSYVEGISEKPDVRIGVSQALSEDAMYKLARLDVEKFSWAKVYVGGRKDEPCYVDMPPIPIDDVDQLKRRLKIEEAIDQFLSAGHMLALQVGEASTEELLEVSKLICKTSKVDFFVYNRRFIYCENCQETFAVSQVRCPKCKSGLIASYERPVSKIRLYVRS